MNKKEIEVLSNEELIAHAMHMEYVCTIEENSRRGISKKTIKDYKFTVEELAKRFNFDKTKLIELTKTEHWWD